MQKLINMFMPFIFMILLIGCRNSFSTNNYANGTWIVYELHSQDKKIVGNLSLQSGKYMFEAIDNTNISQRLRTRLPFIDQPIGKTSIKFNMSKDQSVQSLPNSTVIGTCQFGDYSEKFQIRIDQDKNIFYFHGEFSEIQLWAIEKQIN